MKNKLCNRTTQDTSKNQISNYIAGDFKFHLPSSAYSFAILKQGGIEGEGAVSRPIHTQNFLTNPSPKFQISTAVG